MINKKLKCIFNSQCGTFCVGGGFYNGLFSCVKIKNMEGFRQLHKSVFLGAPQTKMVTFSRVFFMLAVLINVIRSHFSLIVTNTHFNFKIQWSSQHLHKAQKMWSTC